MATKADVKKFVTDVRIGSDLENGRLQYEDEHVKHAVTQVGIYAQLAGDPTPVINFTLKKTTGTIFEAIDDVAKKDDKSPYAFTEADLVAPTFAEGKAELYDYNGWKLGDNFVKPHDTVDITEGATVTLVADATAKFSVKIGATVAEAVDTPLNPKAKYVDVVGEGKTYVALYKDNVLVTATNKQKISDVLVAGETYTTTSTPVAEEEQ